MEYVSSIERVLLAKARLQGKEEGWQEGWREGHVKFLCRLLNRRFGALPSALLQKIQLASVEQIQAWFDVAIDATDLGTIFQEPPH
jgi:predicted transposase YdaD